MDRRGGSRSAARADGTLPYPNDGREDLFRKKRLSVMIVAVVAGALILMGLLPAAAQQADATRQPVPSTRRR